MFSFACQDIEFEDLLRCSFELNKAEYAVFIFLLKYNEFYTTSKLSDNLKIDRSTVQKAIKQLVDKDLVVRHQENLLKGGYKFHYKVNNKNEIKQRMKQIVDKWYEQVLTEVGKW